MLHTTNHTINSLPPELLGHIIIHASLDDPCAPLRLAGLSRTFHHVSMSTPGAWTKLSLRVTNASELQMLGSEVVPCAAVRKAEIWFQRAGACPVDVSVEMLQASIQFPLAPRSVSAGTYALEGEEEEGVGDDQGGLFLLSRLLSRFRDRIRSLALHTTIPEEAQAFFDAVYRPMPLEFGPYDLPLEALTLVAASDGASHAHRLTHLERMPALKSRPPPGSISDALCRNNFSRLEHLTFVNHPLPLSPVSSPPPMDDSALSESSFPPPAPLVRLLSAETGHRLRSLCITYPLRFAPIPLLGLLDVLRATPGLERLELEGRVSLGETSYHQHQQGRDTSSGYASASDRPPMGVLASTNDGVVSHTHVSPSSSSFTPLASFPSHPHMPSNARQLLALPSLSTFAVKANNLPAILSSLVLPVLRELRIDDMDGKRPDAARETAEALRGLMVRGEMPLDGLYAVGMDGRDEKRSRAREGKKAAKGGGLEVLDMCNIALCRPRGISAVLSFGGGVPAYHPTTHILEVHHDATHSLSSSHHHNTNDDDAAVGLWRWCFGRMCNLRELRVAKMDMDMLLWYITPPLSSSRSSQPSFPHPSTADDGCRSREGVMRRYGAVLSGETGKEFSSGLNVTRELEVGVEADVDAEVNSETLPRLKRLVLVDYRPVLTGLGDAMGAVSSVAPHAGNAWDIGHDAPSAALRMFKTRRPDVGVENVSTRSCSAVSPATLQPATVPHTHALQEGRVDYLSLYL